jgi:hypothetical protein
MPKGLSRACARQACELGRQRRLSATRRHDDGRLTANQIGWLALCISVIDYDIAVLDKATRAQALTK